MGEPLTPEEQFALRSEIGKMMRISRIPGNDALYGAPISAQNLDGDGGGQVILNPIDCGEVTDVNIANVVGGVEFPHIIGYVGCLSKKSKDANAVNLPKKIKR